jgi:hypothetical protein
MGPLKIHLNQVSTIRSVLSGTIGKRIEPVSLLSICRLAQSHAEQERRNQQRANHVNIYDDIFNRHKYYCASSITKSFEWRLDQLDRLAQMLSEHTNEFHDAPTRDFKTALFGRVFDVAVMLGTIEVTKVFLSRRCNIEASIPKFHAESGRKAIVMRRSMDHFFVLRPAIIAPAAENICI